MSVLCNLPDEILLAIFEHLSDDPGTLCSFIVCSSACRALGEPMLYRHVSIRDVARHNQFVRSLRSSDDQTLNRHRAGAIRTIDWYWGYQNLHVLPKLEDIFDEPLNIKELTIESPFSVNYYSRLQDDEGIPSPWVVFQSNFSRSLAELTHFATPSTTKPLSNLKKLTLHWNGDGDRFWRINGNLGAVFAHPNLEHLTLSCAVISDNSLADVISEQRTPLKHLTLTECCLTQGGLQKILARPRALQTLDLGEIQSYFNNLDISTETFNRLYSRDTSQFFAALSQQQRSLEEFTYRPQSTGNPIPQLWQLPSDCEGFTNFKALKLLAYHGFLEDFLCAVLEETVAPPQLQSLHVIGTYLVTRICRASPRSKPSPFLTRALNPKHSHLQELILADTPTSNDPDIESKDISRLSKAVKAAGQAEVRLRITQRVRPRGFIPPYLYSEPVPFDKVLFDSSDPVQSTTEKVSPDGIQTDENVMTGEAAPPSEIQDVASSSSSTSPPWGDEQMSSVEAEYFIHAAAE